MYIFLKYIIYSDVDRYNVILYIFKIVKKWIINIGDVFLFIREDRFLWMVVYFSYS